MLIVANTNTTQSQVFDVILEIVLSAPGDRLRILYSNKPNPTASAPVTRLNQVTVKEIDGTTGNGPLNTTRVTLQAMEIQILQR